MDEADTSSDWRALVSQHPLFDAVDDEDVAFLLSDDVSIKHSVGKDETILKQDSIGDSLFVICEGSVSVMLEGPDGSAFELHRSGKGEVLGEMALFGQRLRAATLVTAEPCKLLEIKGDAFRELMRKHSDIALYLLAKLSQRLRRTDDLILSRRITSLDGAMGELSSQINRVEQTTDAKLAATQTMFQQTNTRAGEIIESVNSNLNFLKWVGAAAATLGGVFITIVGLIGYNSFYDLYDQTKAFKADVEVLRDDTQSAKAEAETLRDETAAAASAATDAVAEAEGNAEASREAREIAEDNALKIDNLRQVLRSEVALERFKRDLPEEAAYDKSTRDAFIEVLQADDAELRDDLITYIHERILAYGQSDAVVGALEKILEQPEDYVDQGRLGRIQLVMANYFMSLAYIKKDDLRAAAKFRDNIRKIVSDDPEEQYFQTIFGEEHDPSGWAQLILIESDDPPETLADGVRRLLDSING